MIKYFIIKTKSTNKKKIYKRNLLVSKSVKLLNIPLKKLVVIL